MTGAMKILLQYAEENMIHALMVQEPEYFSIRSHVEKQEKEFRSLLTEETAKCFEALTTERNQLDFIYEQALFRAGFQIAIELVRE